MHRGFKVIAKSESWDEKYLDVGKEVRLRQVSRVKRKLSEHVGLNGRLSADDIAKQWFPLVKADVFISHSHRDINYALKLSGWLKVEFGIEAFVDSVVWQDADKMLRDLDDEWCRLPNGNYQYDKRNGSTSFVHTMLMVAIGEMIDQSECLFFLKTPSSSTAEDIVKKTNEEKTSSPWIYTELTLSKLIRKKETGRPEVTFESLGGDMVMDEIANYFPDYEHKIDVSHLTELTIETLKRWRRTFTGDGHPLDALYKVTM